MMLEILGHRVMRRVVLVEGLRGRGEKMGPVVDSCMSAPQMPQEVMGLWVQYTESLPLTTFLLNPGY